MVSKLRVCYKDVLLALSNDKFKAWALQGRKREDLDEALSNGVIYPMSGAVI